MVTAVVFDIGETVLDESGEWEAWADWLGVPRHTFSAVLGATGDSTRAFEIFRPGFDIDQERQRRREAGHAEQIGERDIYPDVRQCIAALNRQGLWVGLTGTQAELLTALKLPVDQIVNPAATKPGPAFFEQVIDLAPGSPSEIVYVGDHRDDDIVPAKKAGLRTVLIRRGPWGHLWADDPVARESADWVIDSLAELPALISPVRT